MFEMSKQTYRRYAQAHAKQSPLLKDCLHAFLVGGTICLSGQILKTVYLQLLSLPDKQAATLTSVTLITLAALLTGLGVFDDIARFAGAGTLVPITGFSNAVASAAIDSHAEGFVLGEGAKIFAVAGPVLLYGTTAGAIWGVICYALRFFA